MMAWWRFLSASALFLAKALAAVDYCNSNGDICAKFKDGFNLNALGEITHWWDELEKNVKPLKCEFSRQNEQDMLQVIIGYVIIGWDEPFKEVSLQTGYPETTSRKLPPLLRSRRCRDQGESSAAHSFTFRGGEIINHKVRLIAFIVQGASKTEK